MFDRHALLLAFTASVVASGPGAHAAEQIPYTTQAFEAAQSSGDPILVEVTASWCPVYKAQKPILARVTAQPEFKSLKAFEVDFDSQKMR